MSRWGTQPICLLAIVAMASSCGFTKRSDEFKCDTTDECAPDRVCHDNWCVLPETIGDANLSIDATPDAPLSPADAQVTDATPCPSECTSCQNDLCLIVCDQANDCFVDVICPADMRCQVTCSGASACAGVIDCTMATDCDITCSNSFTCLGKVRCGTGGPCTVTCSGADSCAEGIDCRNSCVCTTDCSGTNSCGRNPNCPGGAGTCRDMKECVATPADPCNTCP